MNQGRDSFDGNQFDDEVMTNRIIESGVPPKELHIYFSALADQKGKDLYRGRRWTVSFMESRKVRMGALRLTVTRLQLTGPASVLEELISEFRMRFLSAGG